MHFSSYTSTIRTLSDFNMKYRTLLSSSETLPLPLFGLSTALLGEALCESCQKGAMIDSHGALTHNHRGSKEQKMRVGMLRTLKTCKIAPCVLSEPWVTPELKQAR